MKPFASTLIVAAIALNACAPPAAEREASAFTLYRTGAALPDIPAEDSSALQAMRIHVATFNASHGADYNRENCETARILFGEQPGVTAKYWCEKGTFRP